MDKEAKIGFTEVHTYKCNLCGVVVNDKTELPKKCPNTYCPTYVAQREANETQAEFLRQQESKRLAMKQGRIEKDAEVEAEKIDKAETKQEVKDAKTEAKKKSKK